jgi:hypothetical protein
MLSIEQIDQILDVLRKQNITFIAKQLGPDYLTKEEKLRLKKYGIDVSKYYSLKGDVIMNSFYFGLISDALGKDAHSTTIEQLKTYFEQGKHIPLTQTELMTIDSIKKQCLKDVKAHQGRIFSDINGTINQFEKNNREEYENVIKDVIEEGKLNKKVNGEIARDIARKTGDWSRDFSKVVEFVSHMAFDEGRAAMYERKNGKDAKVYKNVFEGACKHCVKLYLTNGIGSKPIVFKLSELKANGTNIGRKVDEWKAVIGSTHVFCRCTLQELPEGYEWNEEKKQFELVKKPESEMKRKPIRISFNNKEYSV